MKNRMACEQTVGSDLHIGCIPKTTIQEHNTKYLIRCEMHSVLSVCRNSQISLALVVWV